MDGKEKGMVLGNLMSPKVQEMDPFLIPKRRKQIKAGKLNVCEEVEVVEIPEKESIGNPTFPENLLNFIRRNAEVTSDATELKPGSTD